MKTRSGLKYQDGKLQETTPIKSQQKEAKNTSKAKTVVKEKPNEETVIQNESKRTRNKANTDVKAKKLVVSPKKSPPKEAKNNSKAKSEDKEKPNEEIVTQIESKRTRSKANTDVKAKELVVSPKESPKKETKNTSKAKSEVKEKLNEEIVIQNESKRTRSKANTNVNAKKLVISPKKSPKKPTISSKEKSLKKPVISPKKKSPKKPMQSIESKRPVRKTRTQTIEVEKVVTKKPKSESIQILVPKEVETIEEEKPEKLIISEEKETDSPIEVQTESKKSNKSNEVVPKQHELMDTTEIETKPPEPQTLETNPPEPQKIETTPPEPQTIEPNPLEPQIIETSPPESQIIETNPPEPQPISFKRKSTEIESKSLVTKPEGVKRLRVSRFSVPSIPQICGQLYSFGDEIAGELGPRLKRIDDIKLKSNEPSVVTDKEGLALDNIVSIVCGAMHSSCLSSEGEVLTFGCNDDFALGRDTLTGSDQTDDSIDIDESEEREAKTPKLVTGLPPAVKMTAGDMHTCALCKDGSVYVWGNFKDESKKSGLFVESPKIENSDDFKATTLPKRIQLETKVVDIASGCHHILLLTEEGDVLSFGEGSKGQLGRIKDTELHLIASDRQLFLKPQKVEFGAGIVVEKIWANHWSSYAKTTSGDIYVWGLNNYHQLGFKSNGSVRVTNSDPNESQTTLNSIIELNPTKAEKMPKNVVMIANGQHHMLALDAEGQVFSCGSNTYGKLGYETDSSDQTAESPQMINTDAFNKEKVTHISCGEFCSFAITQSGHLMAWGQGSAHIGSQDFTDIEVPTCVKGSLADSTRFVSVSSGSQHTLLIGNKNTINGN